MSKNYYEILNINNNATNEEIKRAYHKLALQFHPDKNTSQDAEEEFKKISEAYEILSDSSKRLMYDNNRFNSSALQFNNAHDIFSRAFGGNININQININNIFASLNMQSTTTFRSVQQTSDGQKLVTEKTITSKPDGTQTVNIRQFIE
jgi:molecular chaperone DnaJ